MRALVSAIFAVIAISTTASASLTVSPNGRYLVDSGGSPFLMVGDAGWSLVTQITVEDAQDYLDDRAARGFNLVLVRLIDHYFCDNPPANAYGQRPFTGANFVTPNPAYFDRVAQVISYAAQRGIVIMLAPVYLGYGCGDEGWCAEVEAASLASMRTWGRYVGQRFGGFDNIIWVMGGDTDPTPVAAKVREVVLGIREYDTVHLMTCHNQRETQAITPWPGETWIQVNNVYTSDDPPSYMLARQAYQVTPALPFFLVESYYENEHNTTSQKLRAQAYWTTLCGGFGQIFGNCPIWHFGWTTAWCGLGDWIAELDSPGALNMTYFRRLFASRHWTSLVPDFTGAVLTSGRGSWGSIEYAMAASTQDGSSIIAYLPTSRSVTVAMTTLAGTTVRAWWYAPATGNAVLIGTYAKGTRAFTPPTSGDWVLVVDNAALDLPPPGTPSTPIGVPDSPSTQASVQLEKVEPNPWSTSTVIRYNLAVDSTVRVEVFGIDGRRVRSLAEGQRSVGSHSVFWDGKDAGGRGVPAGIYLVRVQTPAGTVFKKMVRLE